MSESDRTTRAHQVRAALGSVLRRHREASGRTLADVAAAAQCSPAHLSDVERGRKDVSAQRLVAVVAALDVPLHVLYGDLADDLAPAAVVDARGFATDPRAQIELAAAALGGEALQAVAAFSTYLANTSVPARRRIGFVVPQQRA